MNGNSFQEIGFTRLIDRLAVALAIRASVEWTSACSASAQAMVFELGPPLAYGLRNELQFCGERRVITSETSCCLLLKGED